MKVRVLLTTFLFLVFTLFFSCDTTEPGGDPPKPPGYQEDIPWPSLADSPWPMYRADPQNTGRSKYAGASSGITAWSSEEYVVSSCIVGEDGTIYFIAEGQDSGFYALNPNGTVKWKIPLEILEIFEAPTAPVLTSNGTIYFNDPQGKQFYAVDTSGYIKWKIDGLYSYKKIQAITLDKSGNIFFLGLKDSGTNLYYISKEGKILWNIENNDFTDGMSFSPDGNTIYIPGSKQSGTAFYALDPNGTIKWEFKGTKKIDLAAPVVDSNGNCYIIASPDGHDFYLYSINSNGIVLWEISLGGLEYENARDIALDKLGNLYFGVNSVISVSIDGTINWEKKLGGYPSYLTSPLSINKNNEIYFTAYEEKTGLGEELWKMDNDGEVIWRIPLDDTGYPEMSPVIGFNEVIIMEISKNFLKIIR